MCARQLDEVGEVQRDFIRDVASRAPLPAHVTVEDAVSFVLGVVAERLTRGAAHTMLRALPAAVGAMLEVDLDRRRGPPSTLDRPELLDRTAARMGVTPATAERICAGVLSAVREWLPPSTADDVAAQLPRDLKELWSSSPAPTATPAPTWEAEDAQARVFAAVEREGVLPANVDVANAFMAVMCIFSQRLSGGEARHVLLGLPSTIRPLVTTCMLHRGEQPAVFDRDELFRRVAEHLGVAAPDAERITRAVLGAVKRELPEKEVGDVTDQLPEDLRSFWTSA